MKSVVVTGATSMIGVALIEECIKNNVKVLAILRKDSNRLYRLPQSELIRILECDLDDLESISREENYDVFYHLAWSHSAKIHRDNPILQEENIRTTMSAVTLAKKLGCYKFIGAGSQAEYGKVDHVISPDTPVDPATAYGIAKYAAGRLSEKLCRQYGLIHIWGRIFSVYGRYDNAGTMLDYAINQFLRAKPAEFSAATQMWDYLHEKDAGQIFFLLGEKVEKNSVYCIANGNARPLKEFILQVKENFGTGAECRFAKETRDSEIFGLQADISTLINDTGYVPETVFSDGIADMIRYKTEKYKTRQESEQNGR